MKGEKIKKYTFEKDVENFKNWFYLNWEHVNIILGEFFSCRFPSYNL